MAMTLRLPPEEKEALREMARREGRSMNDVARAAIGEYVALRTRRNQHLRSIIREDSALLGRLGTS